METNSNFMAAHEKLISIANEFSMKGKSSSINKVEMDLVKREIDNSSMRVKNYRRYLNGYNKYFHCVFNKKSNGEILDAINECKFAIKDEILDNSYLSKAIEQHG